MSSKESKKKITFEKFYNLKVAFYQKKISRFSNQLVK